MTNEEKMEDIIESISGGSSYKRNIKRNISFNHKGKKLEAEFLKSAECFMLEVYKSRKNSSFLVDHLKKGHTSYCVSYPDKFGNNVKHELDIVSSPLLNPEYVDSSLVHEATHTAYYFNTAFSVSQNVYEQIAEIIKEEYCVDKVKVTKAHPHSSNITFSFRKRYHSDDKRLECTLDYKMDFLFFCSKPANVEEI